MKDKATRIWVDDTFVRELQHIKISLKLAKELKSRKNKKYRVTNQEATKELAKYLKTLRNRNY